MGATIIRKFFLQASVALCCLLVVGCYCSKKEVRKSPYRIVLGTISIDTETEATEKRVQGFATDLLFAIAQIHEMKLQIETVNGPPTLQLLSSPNVDAIITLISPTQQALRTYLFSDPFFVEGPVIVSRFGGNYDSLYSLRGKAVGIEQGYLWSLQQSEQRPEPVDVIFQSFDNTSEMIDALVAGRVEAIIMNSIVASNLARGIYWGKIDVTSVPLLIRGVRLVVKHGKNEELIKYFNEGLKKLIQDGTYGRMLNYWSLFNAKDPSSI